MKIFNYSEARQKLSYVLNLALEEEVFVKRKNGTSFKIIPIETKNLKSPFDFKGIKTNIKTEEILNSIRESRERT